MYCKFHDIRPVRNRAEAIGDLSGEGQRPETRDGQKRCESNIAVRGARCAVRGGFDHREITLSAPRRLEGARSRCRRPATRSGSGYTSETALAPRLTPRLAPRCRARSSSPWGSPPCSPPRRPSWRPPRCSQPSRRPLPHERARRAPVVALAASSGGRPSVAAEGSAAATLRNDNRRMREGHAEWQAG